MTSPIIRPSPPSQNNPQARQELYQYQLKPAFHQDMVNFISSTYLDLNAVKQFWESIHSRDLCQRNFREMLPFFLMKSPLFGSVMHYLIYCKRFGSEEIALEAAVNIKFIEITAGAVLSEEEKELYLYCKNSKGWNYLQLDVQFQDEKIRQTVKKAFEEYSLNTIYINPKKLFQICQKEHINSKSLFYRADSSLTIDFDNGTKISIHEGDTLLLIAARYFRVIHYYQAGEKYYNKSWNYIYQLIKKARLNMSQGGKAFLNQTNLIGESFDRLTTPSRWLLKDIQKVRTLCEHAFVSELIDALCKKSAFPEKIIRENLHLLATRKLKKDLQFLETFVSRLWVLSDRDDKGFKNYYALYQFLSSPNLNDSPETSYCQIILNQLRSNGSISSISDNPQLTTPDEIKKGLLNVSRHIVLITQFLRHPEVFDDHLLFNYRAQELTNKLRVDVHSGDTFLHIATKAFIEGYISKERIQKLISRTLASNDPEARKCLFARNSKNQTFVELNESIKSVYSQCKEDHVKKLFQNFSKIAIQHYKDNILTNLDIISEVTSHTNEFFHQIVNMSYWAQTNEHTQKNLEDFMQLMDQQIHEKVPSAFYCQKILNLKNSKGVTLKDYFKSRQQAWSLAQNQMCSSASLQGKRTSTTLTPNESFFITKMTDQAREAFLKDPQNFSKDKFIEMALSLYSSMQAEKLETSSGASKEKFKRKLINSIEKIN